MNLKNTNPVVVALAVAVLFSIVVHFSVFFPGEFTYRDWWNYSSLALRDLFPLPGSFQFEFNVGQDASDALNYFPIAAAMGLIGGFLHLGFGIAERAVVILPIIVLTPVAGYLLARIFITNVYACAVAGVFFACNTYIDVISTGGQLTIAEAYAFGALCAVNVLRMVHGEWKSWRAIISGVLLVATAAFDVRIAVLLVLWLVLMLPVMLKPASYPRILKALSLFCFTALAMAAYIILPPLVLRNAPHPPGDFSSAVWLPRLSVVSFTQAVTLDHPYWYDNLSLHAFNPLFLALPIFAGAALVLKWQRTEWRPRLVVLVVGVLLGSALTAGTDFPTGNAYLWLFTHFWPMSLFRDPSKFYLLVIFSYVPLVAIGVERILSLVRGRAQSAAFLVMLVIAGVPSLHILVGNERGIFAPRTSSGVEAKFSLMLSADDKSSRVLWAPAPDRMVPGDYLHPQLDSVWLSSVVENHGSVFRSAAALQDALKTFGVGYVAIRYDDATDLIPTENMNIFRTLRMYATLGAFGKAIIRTRSLVVYRTGFAIEPITAVKASVYRVAHEQADDKRFSAQRTCGASSIAKVEVTGIALGRCFLDFPRTFLPAASIPTIGAHQLPVPGTLLSPSSSVRVSGTVSVKPFAGEQYAVRRRLRIPDWTQFIDVELSLKKAATRVMNLRLHDGVYTRSYNLGTANAEGGRKHVLLDVQGLDPEISLRIAGCAYPNCAIGSITAIPTSYFGLVDSRDVGVPRNDETLHLNFPLSAFSLPIGAETRAGIVDEVRGSPALVKGKIFVSQGQAVVLPFAASPMWRVRGSGVRIELQHSEHPLFVTLVALKDRPRFSLDYRLDFYLRLGAIISAATLIAVLIASLFLMKHEGISVA